MSDPVETKEDGSNHLSLTVERGGEILEHQMAWVWCEACQIEAGEAMAPIVLKGEDALEYADLTAITDDLSFAKFCFSQAIEQVNKQGTYRAFINAGLVSYARAFDKGVRSTKLHPEQFPHWSADEKQLHDHLFALRQKHVAHSVNAYEYCNPIGMIVLDKAGQRRPGLTGLGVIFLKAVGMSDALLKDAVQLIDDIDRRVSERINAVGHRLYPALKEHLDGGGAWEMSPVAQIPMPNTVTERRKR